jgi:hypothetical protein
VSGGATSKGVSAWGGGQEKRDVGASMVGRAGRRLGRRRWLTGGVRGPTRASERAVSADGEGPPDRGRKRARELGGLCRQVGPTGQRERGSGDARALASVVRLSEGGCGWAELGRVGPKGRRRDGVGCFSLFLFPFIF